MPTWLENGAVIAVLVFLGKELYQFAKSRVAKFLETVEANTDAVRSLQSTFVSFQDDVRRLTEMTNQIPKMQRDLDVAHAHLRAVAPHLYNPPVRPDSGS